MSDIGSDDASFPTELVVFVRYPIGGFWDIVLSELEQIFSRVTRAKSLLEWRELLERRAQSRGSLLFLVDISVGPNRLNEEMAEGTETERAFFPQVRGIVRGWGACLPFPGGAEKTLILLRDEFTSEEDLPLGNLRKENGDAHETLLLLGQCEGKTNRVVEQILYRAIWQFLRRQGLPLAFDEFSTPFGRRDPLVSERVWNDFLERVVHLRNRRYAEAFAPIEGRKEQ